MYRKTSHAAQFPKSCALNGVVYLILVIELFQQQCVILKGMFQSDWIKQHVIIIGIDPLLSNSAMCKHLCLENIKKLYTSSGKFDDQHHYKNIIESALVSTPERFNNNMDLLWLSERPLQENHYVYLLKLWMLKVICCPPVGCC